MNAAYKRKRGTADAQKFYAVRIGRQPGIYPTWADCSIQVNAYPKAAFKSFATISDAQAYINGTDATAKSKPGRPLSWFAVRSGHAPGIYTSRSAVDRALSGYTNPIYSEFATKADADAYLAADTTHEHDGELRSTKKLKPAKTKLLRQGQLTASEVDLSKYPPGEAPLPVETEDGFDSSIILDEASGQLRYRNEAELTATKPQAVKSAGDTPIIIYTDGSTLRNGSPDAISGVGVYFGPLDKRNVSETLSGKKQTNQRAELTGIIRALELAPRNRKVVIRTDSDYSIKCVTVWFKSWQKNGWVTSSRKSVDNKDLVVKIIDLLEERIRINKHRQMPADNEDHHQVWDRGPAGVRFEWVKGHSIDQGNQAVDELALQGARKAQELDALGDDKIDI